MNTKHLEYFIAVAEEGSLNKAAARLFISQPQLGKIIRDLENQVNMPLFNRSPSGMYLTKNGESFLSHAKTIVRETKKLWDLGLSDTTTPPALRVSMTKFSHIMDAFINVVLKHKDEKAFCHRLTEGSPQEVIEEVHSGGADVGVLHFDTLNKGKWLQMLEDKGLSYHEMAKLIPCILLSANHPLLKENRPITLSDLSPYALIRYDGEFEDFIYHIFSESADHNLNLSSKIVYMYGRASLLHLLECSDFYSIGIPAFISQNSQYHVISIPIETSESLLEFGYIHSQDYFPNALTEEFLSEVKDQLDRLIAK